MQTFSPKSQDSNGNRYALIKIYEERETNEVKQQIGIISAYEILILRELIRQVMDKMLVTLYVNSNKQDDGNNGWNPSNEEESNCYGNDNDNGNDDRGFIDRIADDDIPF